MELQMAFNIAVALVAFLGGWVLNTITKRLDENRSDLHSIRNKVQAIEVVMAGTYVKKEDLEKLGNTIFAKLDKIEERISTTRIVT
jgi:hypothetical protein